MKSKKELILGFLLSMFLMSTSFTGFGNEIDEDDN